VYGGLTNQILRRGGSGLPEGAHVTEQIQLPAVIQNRPNIDNNPEFPIANINYVEILGQPGNIGI